MDKLAEALASTPSAPDLPHDQLANQCTELLQNYLYKTPAATLAHGPKGNDLLELIHPEVQTLGYVFILCSKLDITGPTVFNTHWGHTTKLLETYDHRQLRFCRREFRRLVEAFVRYAFDNDKPIAAVRPLQKAILRSADPTEFSFMHERFLRACLRAKCLRAALPVLDINIFDFPDSKSNTAEGDGESTPKEQDVTYQDVLSYFLFGGIVYIGVKNWTRALDFLSYVVAAPGNHCSAIQVEAYKKYVLVGLMLNGKVVGHPRSTPPQCQRTYDQLAKPYKSFAAAFASGDVNVFQQEIAATAEEFMQDANSGLAKQCIKAFRKQQIIALQDTYVTLGVDEIAQRSLDASSTTPGDSAETEHFILGMIKRGELSASLSHSSADPNTNRTTVHFDSGSHTGCDSAALEEQIRRTVTLTKQVKVLDRKISLSKEYIRFQLKQQKGAGAGPPPGGLTSLMDGDLMDWDEQDPDAMDDVEDD